MKIPNSVKVAGMTYKIIKNYKFRDKEIHLLGQQNSLLGVIKLSGEKQSEDALGEVFLHELLHAIDYAYNGGSLKEKQVEAMAKGLYQVLKDNDIDMRRRCGEGKWFP